VQGMVRMTEVAQVLGQRHGRGPGLRWCGGGGRRVRLSPCRCGSNLFAWGHRGRLRPQFRDNRTPAHRFGGLPGRIQGTTDLAAGTGDRIVLELTGACGRTQDIRLQVATDALDCRRILAAGLSGILGLVQIAAISLLSRLLQTVGLPVQPCLGAVGQKAAARVAHHVRTQCGAMFVRLSLQKIQPRFQGSPDSRGGDPCV
jgi:hypothetical protein